MTMFPSALQIVKPLPKVTYLTPGKDLNMSITINASITSVDDIILSLEHSSEEVYENLTKYLIFKLTAEEENEEPSTGNWKINMTLPYPYCQTSGELNLIVRDSHSGDFTTTELIIRQDEDDKTPYFDPVPRSVKINPGQDVFINTRIKGTPSINVSLKNK